MNNRETITLLRNLEDSLDAYCELNEEGKTAFRMAIEALNCSEFPNNSDTISRQAAIEAIDRYYKDKRYITRSRTILSAICRDMKSTMDSLPSAQPEQRWIPCSEGLPEVHETGNSFSGVYMQSYPVLVYGVPEGEEECGFHVVTYCDDLNGYTYWSTELDAVTIDGVRAWMPLPEPYAERREE